MTQSIFAPTKSNLLKLRKQLAFALEGFELLDQKRQLLTLELVRRLERLRETEHRTAQALARAHEVLREATLDSGSEALERMALGVPVDHEVSLSDERLIGTPSTPGASPGQTSGGPVRVRGHLAQRRLAHRRFVEVLPLLAELAELQNAVLRLTRELRKTQRRCNALTKIFIPDCRQAIHYIAGALEERERESFMDRKLRNARGR